MRRFLGAKELGLETSWRFGFTGVGSTVEPVPGVLYIDAGGSLREGILDHHAAAGAAACAAGLVFRHREAVYNHLMRGWLQLHDEGRIAPGAAWTPTLITHEDPDWDGIAAAFLAMRLVEDGDFPPYAAALAEYAREVDQGRYRFLKGRPDSRYAIHIAYAALASSLPDSEQRMRSGLELLRRSLDHIAAARQGGPFQTADFYPGSPGATAWLDDPWFAPAREILLADRDRFERDLARGRIADAVALPAADGSAPIAVRTFIGGAPMESRLHKYWVREQGCPLFVCPFAHDGNTIDRVIISVDPDFDAAGRKPGLQGLGFQLERLEVRRRRERFGGRDDRGGPPRFGGGYCDNDDPWYDGRSFAHTIVDSPRSGTVIPYQEIVRTVCETPFWELPLRRGVVSLIWRDASPDAHAKHAPLVSHPGLAATLGDWRTESSEAVVPLPEHFQLPPGCTVLLRRRRHPDATCAPFLVATLEAAPGATLEALIEARSLLIRQIGRGAPDYSVARIAEAASFASSSRIGHLLCALNDGAYAETTQIHDSEEMLFFDNRAVVFRDCGTDPSASAAGAHEFETGLEVLLYLAFLNETLSSFSAKISRLVPSGKRALNAAPLCQDFLRFQARYYRLDVCRAGRGRLIWEKLAASFDLAGNYAEVRSELDRLEQIERQLAQKRRERADAVLQIGLYSIALFAIYQTIIAYIGTDAVQRNPSWFWLPSAAVTILAAVFYFLARHSAHE